MHASRDEMALAMEGPGFWSRQVSWGEFHVARERCDVPLDLTDAFRALPGGRCTCPHWGYVLEGRITFQFSDHDEVVVAGEVYHVEAGHVPMPEPGSEVLEFTPLVAYEAMVAAMQAAAPA